MAFFCSRNPTTIDGQVLLWKNGTDAELPHDAPYQFPACFHAAPIVKCRQYPSLATGRIFRIKSVDLIYQITFLLRNDGPMIKAAATYPEHGTLADDRHPVVF